MKLTKLDYAWFAAAFFLQPWLIYLWVGYRFFVFVDHLVMTNYSLNRFTFGVFCTLNIMVLGYLISQG